MIKFRCVRLNKCNLFNDVVCVTFPDTPFICACVVYKVVQIWPGRFVCKQVTVCPGHIWTTLYDITCSPCRPLNPLTHETTDLICHTYIRVLRFSPIRTIPPIIHTLHLRATLIKNDKRAKPGNLNIKKKVLPEICNAGQNSTFKAI
jgi:hypothetical protein